jgi:16S rRNA C1402 (ribose-2'-O) methylase RsmI
VEQILTQFEDQTIPNLGEYVILMQGDDGENLKLREIATVHSLFTAVCPVITHKAAVELARKVSSLPKNLLYNLAQEYYSE